MSHKKELVLVLGELMIKVILHVIKQSEFIFAYIDKILEYYKIFNRLKTFIKFFSNK